MREGEWLDFVTATLIDIRDGSVVREMELPHPAMEGPGSVNILGMEAGDCAMVTTKPMGCGYRGLYNSPTPDEGFIDGVKVCAVTGRTYRWPK